MAFAFPDLPDDFLVADAAFAEAYDACSSEERASVKTAIARMAAVSGVADTVVRHTHARMRQGFSLHATSCPASWAMVLWDSAYTSPARVLAALMPAILAGVPNILVCRVVQDGTRFPQGLLAALELAGQELVAECGPEDALALVSRCCGEDARGRVILLGQDAVFGGIGRVAAERGVPLLWYGAPARIGIVASSFAGPVDDAALRFAHPEAVLAAFEEGGAQEAFSAIFCAEAAVLQYLGEAPLVLSPGNESYWVWPGLFRDFFMETVLGVSSDAPDISAP